MSGTDSPHRLNYNRYWTNFTEEIQRLEVDFWFYACNDSVIPAVENLLQQFSIEDLHENVKNFRHLNFQGELDDCGFSDSMLGQKLGSINVKIVAFIERPIHGVVEGQHIRCSFLLNNA